MRTLLIATAFTMTALPMTVGAQVSPDAASSDAAKAAPVKDDGDKRVCRKEGITGSRLGGRSVCRSKREWTSVDQANAVELRAARGSSSQH